MRVVILTGISGAGKTSALHRLEDMGYFCVDNLPTQLLDPFIELCTRQQHSLKLAAIVVDVRGGQFFDTQMVRHALSNPRWKDITFEVLYLDASDEKLIGRYKETRRDHPLAHESSLEDGIMREREALQPLKDCATHVLDTSLLTQRELSDTISKLFSQSSDPATNLRVEVVSFGFKRGIPRDADMVLDVRFLPNPFYIPSMRPHTGRDEDVRDFVMNNADTREFVSKLFDLMAFLMPRYVTEGKNRLMVAIGCTGGQHRSVAIAEALGEFITRQGYHTTVLHRDMSTSQADVRSAALQHN